MKRAMKRLLAAGCVLAIAAGCSACGGEAAPVDLNFNYSFTGVLTQNGAESQATFTHGETGWTVTYLAPETLAGLTLSAQNDACTLTYQGLRYEGLAAELPQSAAARLTTQALDDAALSGDADFTKSGGFTQARGLVDGADYTLKFDGKTPVALSVEGEGLTVEISDFQKT
ncbi:MAG: hypothetical protein QM689_01980 [Oscillospiraceae bacterium]